MSTRLIDSSKPYRHVYSIYRHEYLGCMVSAHLVQELENGRLSLRYQGLYPDNFNQFAAQLDQVDKQIVNAIGRLSPQVILKKFAPKSRNEMDFYMNKFKDEIKRTVIRYVNRQMAEIMPLLKDREVYTMGKDGYPAHTQVNILSQRASVSFNFLRDKDGTRYFPTIKMGKRPIFFGNKDSAILSHEPAWMLLEQEIFGFEDGVDGKKLIPFLKKDFISISKSTEETYFKKFVPQIIENYEVDARGIEIEPVVEKPEFLFLVDSSNKETLSMEMWVKYGQHRLKPDAEKKVTAVLQRSGDNPGFARIIRSQEEEASILALLEGLASREGSLMGWEFMSRQEGLAWLSEVVPELESMGVKVEQKGEEAINFERPEITIETSEQGDWFDIKAVVEIGGHKIPFVKFKNHILKGKRDFILPDGSVAILPESWFSDYRHLVEIAEEKDGELLSVRKYQAVVLDMPAANANFQSKMDSFAELDKVPEYALPADLQAELRPYQRRGYDWLNFLAEHSLGGILADDMGLGKTLQTLGMLQNEKEKGEDQPSLIVMPTSLIYNWQAEARKFAPNLKILVHTGVGRTKNPANFAIYDLVLTTYGLVRQDIKILATFPFNYVVLDESQMIKNPTSKTSKAVKELVCKHRLSLTGTPLENSLTDLWSQMGFLNPGLLGTQRFFKDYYVQPIEKGQDKKRMAQLKALISPFILRRTKKKVAHELPPKIELVHYCEMGKEQQKLYDETKNAYRNYLMNLAKGEFNKKKLNILSGLQKLRQIAIHPGLVEEGEGAELSSSGKYQEYERLLDEVLAKGSKVLVFSQFVRLLKILKTDLEKKGVSLAYLDGSTRDRQEQVNRFQDNENVKVFLISLKAGGVGLNLTAAEYVFILDPWWNPAVEAQAVDRSYRIGQKNTVFSYKFITQDTIEEKILLLQQRKAQLSNDIVSVDEDVFKSLNQDDLAEMLS